MAASPAEAVRAVRAGAGPFGGTLLCDGRGPGPASHDGTGRRFVFRPAGDDGWRYALDVELRAPPAPARLAAVLGARAMQRWGEIEVIAKLLDCPAHLVLRQALALGEAALIRDHGMQLLRADTALHWCVVGRVAGRAAGRGAVRATEHPARPYGAIFAP